MARIPREMIMGGSTMRGYGYFWNACAKPGSHQPPCTAHAFAKNTHKIGMAGGLGLRFWGICTVRKSSAIKNVEIPKYGN